MKKKKFTLKRICIIIGIVMLLGLISHQILMSYMFSWSNWEYLDKITTKNANYSITFEASYPPFPPNERLRIKVICKNEMTKKEKEYTIFDFSVPRDDIKWFTLEDIDDNKSELIINNSYGEKRITLVWSDIFP